jgi:hypothetical protein
MHIFYPDANDSILHNVYLFGRLDGGGEDRKGSSDRIPIPVDDAMLKACKLRGGRVCLAGGSFGEIMGRKNNVSGSAGERSYAMQCLRRAGVGFVHLWRAHGVCES